MLAICPVGIPSPNPTVGSRLLQSVANGSVDIMNPPALSDDSEDFGLLLFAGIGSGQQPQRNTRFLERCESDMNTANLATTSLSSA